MAELLAQFLALDPALQMAVLVPVAGGVVWLLRKLGLQCAPGLASVIAAGLFGAAAGYAAEHTWQGAVMGLIAGLAATGAHQFGRQATKLAEDQIDAKERKLKLDDPFGY